MPRDRARDVYIKHSQLRREKERGRNNCAAKQDKTIGIREALKMYRGEIPNPYKCKPGGISEEMWSAVFGWLLNNFKKHYPAVTWEWHLDAIDTYTALFFEHARAYLDQDAEYYIFCWRVRLPLIHLWVQMKNKGLEIPLEPRRCCILKSKRKRKENGIGIGGVLRPFKEIEAQQLMLLNELVRKYYGVFDLGIYSYEYLSQSKYPKLTKGEKGLANFQDTAVRWWLATQGHADLVSLGRDVYKEWLDNNELIA